MTLRPRRLLPLILLVATTCILIVQNPRKVSAQQPWTTHKLWASYWSVEPGFTSTLAMKNNRIRDTLTARISLYFMNGEEYYLEPMSLGPRQTVTISLNRALESLPSSLASRASREGTIEVEFEGPNSSSIMGSVSVANPDIRTAWDFYLYPGSDAASAPMLGAFWFYDNQTDGFVAAQNISENPVAVVAKFQIMGKTYSMNPVLLAAGQGYKLELRKALRKWNLNDVTAGGIELFYEGPTDAIRAHGALFNGKGFSAEIDFVQNLALTEKETFYYRAPRIAIGPPDPALGLPSRAVFEPTLVVHNFNGYAADVNLIIGYPRDDVTASFEIPLSIGVGETRVVSLAQELEGVIPPTVHWVNLELNYAAKHGGIASGLVSVTKDGEHSIRSVVNWTQADNREGWYWISDGDHNTLISIMNSDANPAKVRFSLDYRVDETPYRHDQFFEIPGRGSKIVNINEVIAAGAPDQDGDVIPASVTFGGYKVRKTDGEFSNITTEALIFGKKLGFLTVYNTGCCDDAAFFIPSSLTDYVGFSYQMELWGYDCTGEVDKDYIQEGITTFSSDNAQVATVSAGIVEYWGPGTTTIYGQAKQKMLYPTKGCALTWSLPKATCSVTVKPIISSISPPRGLIGTGVEVVIAGEGLDAPDTAVNAGTGIVVNIQGKSDTSITAVFNVAGNAPSDNHNVTVTVNGQPSNTKTFFVQVPTSVSVSIGNKVTYNGDNMIECDGTNDGARWGYSRCLTYQLLDQGGTAIESENFITEETLEKISSNPAGLNQSPHNSPPAADGTFYDFLAFVSAVSPAPLQGEYIKVKQTLKIDISGTKYTVRVNCLDFQYNDVTITNITGGGTCQ